MASLEHAREGKRRYGRLGAGVALVAAFIGGAGLVAPAANAAVISAMVISVAQDGTAPFSSYDADGHNGIVAVNDSITYTVASSVATAGRVNYTSTLPVGMEWDSTASATSICTLGGSVSPDKRTVTCERDVAGGAESFSIIARVGAVASGASVAPVFSVDSVSATAPPVEVRGESKMEVYLYSQGFTQNQSLNDQVGLTFNVSVTQGVTSPTGNLRGLQSLQSPFTYTMAVPPGAVVKSASVQYGTGSIAYSQSAPGADIVFTVTGATTNFLNPQSTAGTPTNFLSPRASQSLVIWVPNDPNFPAGQTSRFTAQLKGFDPLGLDGTSNFGAGYAPGQDPGYACTGNHTGGDLACVSTMIDRTQTSAAVVGNNVGTTVALGTGAYMLDDGHAYTQGTEPVVPGADFAAHMGFGSSSSAQVSATSPRGCLTWDRELLSLARLPIPKKGGTPPSAFYGGGGTALAAGDYAIEYSATPFADDNARRSTDCGVAGDGMPGWVSDPSSLPGGLASVTAVRLKSDTLVLDPGVSLGMSVLFARTTTAASLALPVNAPLPWFWQFGTHETALKKSDYPSAGSTTSSTVGGFVQAVPSLVRTKVSWSSDSAAPGTAATYTIKPFIVAPIGVGIDTDAKDIALNIAMDSTCQSPVRASLDAVVASGAARSYAVTPADPGPDGILCTDDDGAPASVTIQLGDFVATGGPRGLQADKYTSYPGHQVDLPAVHFDVFSSPMVPSGSTFAVSTLISASTDPSVGARPSGSSGSLTDRFEAASIVVSGVASFRGTKSAITATDGEVAPNEEFTYELSWSNGTSELVGAGTFVDLLPYDGDARGTTGLGASGLAVVAVHAAMMSDAMGSVAVEYTTDPAPAVAAALAVTGNEDGSHGIVWRAAPVPGAGVTALRFITSEQLRPGYAGTAAIAIKAPSLMLGGSLVNDMYGTTAPVGSDPSTVKTFKAVSPVQLASNAGSLAGKVFRDLNYSGDVDAADDTWLASPAVVELLSNGSVLETSNLSADGGYIFTVALGTYDVQLRSGDHDGWSLVSLGSVGVVKDQSVTGFDRLYAEDVAAPRLAGDAAVTRFGGDVVIDVTANDVLAFPSVSVGPNPVDGVALGSIAPAHGTVELVAPSGSSTQSSLRYTPAATWPAQYAGLSSYTDVLSYDWTSVIGVKGTANVAVTVYAQPDSLELDRKVPTGRTLIEDLVSGLNWPDNVGAITTSAAQGNATFDAVSGVLTYTAGSTPTPDRVVITYVDPIGQSGTITVNYELVQSVAANPDVASTVMGAAVDIAVLANDVGDALSIVGVTSSMFGAAQINSDGTVTFTPADGFSGLTSFDYTIEGSLGSRSSATVSVTVYAPPTPSDIESSTSVDAPITAPAWSFAPSAGAGASFQLPAVTVSLGLGAHGLASLNSDGTMTYLPDAGYIGDDRVSFVVRDSMGQEASALWIITVTQAVEPSVSPSPPSASGAPSSRPEVSGPGDGVSVPSENALADQENRGLAATGASAGAVTMCAVGLLFLGLALAAVAVARRRRNGGL